MKRIERRKKSTGSVSALSLTSRHHRSTPPSRRGGCDDHVWKNAYITTNTVNAWLTVTAVWLPFCFRFYYPFTQFHSDSSDTMLPSPRRSPRRHALADRTNDLSVPSSPTRDAKGKRRANDDEGPKKRVKLYGGQDEVEEEKAENQDVEMADVVQPLRFPRSQRHDVYAALRALRSGDPKARRFLASMCHSFYNNTKLKGHLAPSTDILEAFVSSNKADIIRCHSLQSDSFLTPPYACAFSYGQYTLDILFLHLQSI